jgi:hypothetical protein
MLTDSTSLRERHATLMRDITVCDNMIDPDNWEDQDELISELEDMSAELDTLEEVMQLKSPVYCMCFDYPEHPGRTH